jgi:DNA polymerase I-like protein with 3'-5' exonuclease and polymerase domains
MPSPSYELLAAPGLLAELTGRLIAEKKPVGLDIETGYDGDSREGGSLRPETAFIVSVQFTNSLDWGRLVPLRFDGGVNMDNAVAAEHLWDLAWATDDEGLPLIVAHGAKFERRHLARWFFRYLAKHPRLGEAVRASHGYFPVRSCTLLESYAEGENREHGLKEITWANFRYRMRELIDLFAREGGKKLTEKEANSIRFNVLSQYDREVIAYACEDAVYSLKHHLHRWPRVRQTAIYKIEMAVLHEVVCDMEDTGIAYDWNMMRDGSRKGRAFSEPYKLEVLAEFSELAGEPVVINLNSPQQLRDVIYNKCGMPVSHWTDGGKSGNSKPSTDAKTALKGLSKQYRAIRKLLNLRGLTKLCGTYLDTYEDKFDVAADGRAHPSLLQHGTVTGRTSAADPPYQQTPKKYHYELADGRSFDYNFRDSIMAPFQMLMWWELLEEEMGLSAREADPGWYILGFDYSQIELRVFAGEAGEQALIDAFERGDDVHRLTAALMLGVPLDQVTDEDRAVGKTMNFALAYGMSEDGLADRLGITRDEAVELFTQYHAAYPKLKEWSDRTIATSRRTGYVTTKWGRKVRIWAYDSTKRRERREGERSAGNAPIQGSSTGDYKKLAMIRSVHALRKAGLEGKVRLFMDLHDALEFYVRLDVDPADVVRVLQPAVVFPVDGWPAMVAEWHIGQRWGSVMELEVTEQPFNVKLRKKAEPEVPAAEVTGDEDESLPGLGTWKGAPGEKAPEPGPVGPAVPPVRDYPAPAHSPARDRPDLPRQVNIALLNRPTAGQAYHLARYLRGVPGPNTVMLRYEDTTVSIGGTSGLTPAYEPEVSLIFGGAMVYYDESLIDASALTKDLEL